MLGRVPPRPRPLRLPSRSYSAFRTQPLTTDGASQLGRDPEPDRLRRSKATPGVVRLRSFCCPPPWKTVPRNRLPPSGRSLRPPRLHSVASPAASRHSPPRSTGSLPNATPSSPTTLTQLGVGPGHAAPSWPPPARTSTGSASKRFSRSYAPPLLSPPHPARPGATASTTPGNRQANRALHTIANWFGWSSDLRECLALL